MNCACTWEGDPGRTTVKLCGGHQQIVDKSIAAEREACAQIAEMTYVGDDIAKAIRARNQQK